MVSDPYEWSNDAVQRGSVLLANLRYSKEIVPQLEAMDDSLREVLLRKKLQWWQALDAIFSYSDLMKPGENGEQDMNSNETEAELDSEVFLKDEIKSTNGDDCPLDKVAIDANLPPQPSSPTSEATE